MNYFSYSRRKTSVVKVGDVRIGGENPVRVQTMADCDTCNLKSALEQARKVKAAGGEIFRFTTQGVKQAEAAGEIKSALRAEGISLPIVADVHFNPDVAEVAAGKVDKVRINPGNYVDGIHRLDGAQYTDFEYAAEVEKIEKRLLRLLEICKKNGTALRIGVNHGSLSDRILARFGDTPEGLTESCMEFLRICHRENFENVAISIKSSNTLVMVHAVRRLVQAMSAEGMAFPLHLGVTEAGAGEDGRIKSAVGIGALLLDGIGDTIRVSLTEPPEAEIPVARQLVKLISLREKEKSAFNDVHENFDFFSYNRRKTRAVLGIGGENAPKVFARKKTSGALQPDFIFSEIEILKTLPNENFSQPFFVELGEEIDFENLKKFENCVLVHRVESLAKSRELFQKMLIADCQTPVVLRYELSDDFADDFVIFASAMLGALLLDGFGDGVWLDCQRLENEQLISTALGILQATRTRISRTEFVACPGCGRTMFDLQETLARVKTATSHLNHLKIAVMGCIVNGTGEMADADYGYVGAGRGKISLYKKKICKKKNIPQENAVEELINLIKENGDWKEKI